jgi:DNA polymerase
MTPSVTSTASTTTKGMNPEIYDLQLGQKTLGINEKSKSCNRNLMTYDIALAGPRNRFTIATDAGPIIVHNCGYGMGAEKFQTQLLGFGVSLPLAECTRIIEMYRETYDAIPLLWKQADKCLRAMVQNRVNDIGVQPQALCMHPDEGFLFPSGYYLPYPELEYSQKKGYTYKTRKGYTKIYGGKVVENLCQAIARCIIGEQMIRINRKYRVVLTVHDAVASVVREEEAVEAQQYIESCMRWVPSWATGLPLNCESGVGKSYGEC